MEAVLSHNMTDYIWNLVRDLSVEGKMDILARLSRSLSDTLGQKELSKLSDTMNNLPKSACDNAVIEGLKHSLHPSMVDELDECGWMVGQPFPAPAMVEDDSWIDEAELRGNSDIVSDSIIQQNLQAWRSVK